MNKEFIPYEQALALKELGFDEPCFGYYEPNKNLNYIKRHILKDFPYLAKNSEWQDLYGAPLYQQAFRWFRKKYKLYSQTPATGVEESDRIFYNNPIYDELDNIVFHSMDQYDTYEEAELECLKKLIEIIKNI